MQTKNMTLFSIEGMTIYCTIRRDGKFRYRNKMKTYNERSRIRTNEWRRDNPEATIIHRHKSNDVRCKWGCVSINKKFEDSAFHHLHIQGNKDVGVFVPVSIHKAHHSSKDGSILVMNDRVMRWFIGEDESSYSDVFKSILS